MLAADPIDQPFTAPQPPLRPRGRAASRRRQFAARVCPSRASLAARASRPYIPLNLIPRQPPLKMSCAQPMPADCAVKTSANPRSVRGGAGSRTWLVGLCVVFPARASDSSERTAGPGSCSVAARRRASLRTQRGLGWRTGRRFHFHARKNFFRHRLGRQRSAE